VKNFKPKFVALVLALIAVAFIIGSYAVDTDQGQPIKKIEAKLDKMEAKLDQGVGPAIRQLEAKLDKLETKVDSISPIPVAKIEAKLDQGIGPGIGKIEAKLDEHIPHIIDILMKLEAKLDRLETKVDKIIQPGQ